jgi:hypothetical protein
VDVALRHVVERAGWLDFGAVYTKVAFVNGVYSSRLDRSLGSGAVRASAQKLLNAGQELNAAFGDLASHGRTLTPAAARAAISAHGQVIAALRLPGSPDKTVRSFASKFLHFHVAVAPIFDGTASDNVASFRRLGLHIRTTRVLRSERDACRPEDDQWDGPYFQHVVRVRLLWDHLSEYVDPARLSIKGIDHMLLLGRKFLESRQPD